MRSDAWPGSPADQQMSLMNDVGLYALGVILAIVGWYVVREFFRELHASRYGSDQADDLAHTAAVVSDEVLDLVDAPMRRALRHRHTRRRPSLDTRQART